MVGRTYLPSSWPHGVIENPQGTHQKGDSWHPQSAGPTIPYPLARETGAWIASADDEHSFRRRRQKVVLDFSCCSCPQVLGFKYRVGSWNNACLSDIRCSLFKLFCFVDLRLEGKVALITGGASGIGEATARLFARHGAKVVIADVQEELGRAVCDDLRAAGAPATFVRCDVSVEADVRGAVDAAAAEHGTLDVMFNNAGILDPPKPSIVDNDAADFDRVLAVNLRGAFLGTKHAARVMIPARSGSIVTTASVASVIGGLATHAYTCSKHALVGLMRNAAAELGYHGIRVNCVSPAAVMTPLSTRYLDFSIDREALERMASAAATLRGLVLKEEDVAEAVVYLASDESRFVSGHNLVVDGASTTARPPFDPSKLAAGDV